MCATAGRCEAEVQSTTAMHAKIDPQIVEAFGFNKMEIVAQVQNDLYICLVGVVVNISVVSHHMFNPLT